MQAEDDVFGRLLGEYAGEFVMEAGAADGFEVAEITLKPGERLRFDLEAEAGGVAEAPEDAGGVVLEGVFVEDADQARVEVVPAADWIEEFAPLRAVEAESEGVDGEIAAEEVLVDRRAADGREGAGAGVGFGAGGHEVDVMAGDPDCSGEEGRMGDYPRRGRGRRRSSYESLRTSGTSVLLGGPGVSERAGQGDGVAFDGDIDVDQGPVEEEVAQRASDKVEGDATWLRDAEEFVDEASRRYGQRVGEFIDKFRVSHKYGDLS
jgi:hypothetical protein